MGTRKTALPTLRPLEGWQVLPFLVALPACALVYEALNRGSIVVVILGLVATGVIFAQPTAAVVLLVIVCQELNISSEQTFASAYPLLALGHQVYFSTFAKVPIIEWLCIIAAIFATIRSKNALRASRASRYVIAAAVVGLLIGALAWRSGMGVTSALGAPIRPIVLIAAGIVLGATVKSQPGGWARVAVWATLGFAIEVGLGGWSQATGNAPATLSTYYDTALPALAGAVLIAVLLRSGDRQFGRVKYGIAVLGLATIVILSGRRSVWLAFLSVTVLTIAVRTGRARTLAKLLASVGIAFLAVSTLWPAVLVSAGERFGEIWQTSNISAGGASTAGHVNDLVYGFQYAKSSPFWGLGFGSGPLPGLVSVKTLYVHNEWLLDWLRFGIPGLVISVGAMLAALLAGARGLRSNDPAIMAAAVFIWMLPICCYTAPFLSTTSRWPIFLGLALGVVSQVVRKYSGKAPVSGRLEAGV